jgi:diguanylate cyclase (GGDEF)-like protein
MFIDIDHFKDFNARGGEEAGDAVLKAVADRLLAAAGPKAQAIRWGGDEFLVVVHGLTGEPQLQDLAHNVREEVSRPVRDVSFAPDGSATVTVSVIATLIKPEDTIQDLITRVSAPLSEAKQQGRNRVTLQG